MEPVSVPAAILAFLLNLGCVPTSEVCYVDKIEKGGVSIPGVYDPDRHIVYIRKDVVDHGVVVHELYHSCQKKATTDREYRLNEVEAKGVEKAWRNGE
jgi:hypothetical protein